MPRFLFHLCQFSHWPLSVMNWSANCKALCLLCSLFLTAEMLIFGTESRMARWGGGDGRTLEKLWLSSVSDLLQQ